MSHFFRQTLIVIFIAGYIALNGWLPFQAIGHLHEHAHHTAATHATALCSWLCAAGQTVQASDPFLKAEIRVIAEVEIFLPSLVPLILNLSPLSRAPPVNLALMIPGLFKT